MATPICRGVPDERAETEPANSSFAPDATMAVTPAPIATGPDARLNLIVPPLTFTCCGAHVGAASISSVPAPRLVQRGRGSDGGLPCDRQSVARGGDVNRRARGECQRTEESLRSGGGDGRRVPASAATRSDAIH